MQKDAINDSEYFLRIKENIIKNKKQTLSMLDRINNDEVKKIKEYADMPYLETEEEAAENIADINERRDVRKKDNKARTFAPSDNAEKSETNKIKKIVSDSNKDDDDNKNIKKIYDDDDDVIKIFYKDDENIKIFYDDDGVIKIIRNDDYKINGLDENGYNINGLDEYDLDENGYNIRGTKGTKKKNPNINIKFKRAENGIWYDQYGFDKDGFNKDGYDM